ncbi:33873_t:CDS:2 [Gigaspora margarita]|uniref:33873_t:CDS:1 n=1 Tax=Gigaspora margarita TaxID=4874 RepID=A0ABN7V2K2_GIGMA|nr:33873_t:CDS:2 [Gigaspora margarita]
MSQIIEDITLTGNRQSPYYNNTTTIQTTPPNITHPVHFTLELSQPLKIITHNIQGLGVNIKFQQWLEYYNKQQVHIISMTETKWPESTTPYISLTNPLYKLYIVNCNAETAIQRENSMETAIVLHLNLQPYIHNIDKVPGMAIMIDPIKLRGTNTMTFPLTLNKLQDNITNAINDTSNPTQSKKIRTQTAET